MKRCSKCGIEKELIKFNKDKNRKDGHYPFCKECVRPALLKHYYDNHDKQLIRNAEYRRNHKEQTSKYNKVKRLTDKIYKPIELKFKRYIDSAKKRGYSFELTLEQFTDITNKSCHYCGKESTQIFENRNGIDRKDSSIGYIVDNCLPCCEDCNKAKLTRTYLEYIEWIKQSYKHLTSE